MARIEIDNFDKNIEETKKRLAFKIQESLKEKLTPTYGKDTGFLKSNIIAKPTDYGIEISMPYYAEYLEYGTTPHLIFPKNAKALHWKVGGKDIFASMVRHPGTRPFPFIRTTFRNDFPQLLIESLKKSFQ